MKMCRGLIVVKHEAPIQFTDMKNAEERFIPPLFFVSAFLGCTEGYIDVANEMQIINRIFKQDQPGVFETLNEVS